MLTEILFVLDRSGSMEATREAVISGFNAFLDGQRAMPGDVRVTLVQFDTISTEIEYEGAPLSTAPYLTRETFVPRAGTPLLDAIGGTITQQGARFARARHKPDKVILVILTDGAENSSVVYTRDDVVKLIERQRNEWNWTVIYIGAAESAITDAHHLGINGGQAIKYSGKSVGTRAVFGATNNLVNAIRSGEVGATYSAEDRTASDEIAEAYQGSK